jgi:hypothetical protein
MTIAPGNPAFNLTVNGSGFVSTSVVNWNGAALATTYVNSSQLIAAVPASNIGQPGTASVTVSTPAPGGGTSATVFFGITTPVSSPVFTDFVQTFQFGTTGPEAGTPFTADFNHDGKLDLVVGAQVTTVNNPQAVGEGIALGNGDGSFQQPVAYSSQGFDGPVIAADFDGDGNLDLASLAQGTIPSVSILLGNSDGTFQSETTFSTGTGPGTIAAADFNGDGHLDLAIAAFGGNGNQAVWKCFWEMATAHFKLMLTMQPGTLRPLSQSATSTGMAYSILLTAISQECSCCCWAMGTAHSGRVNPRLVSASSSLQT